MSKIFDTLPGIPLTEAEDEMFNRWKHLQTHSRTIVREAIAMVQAKNAIEETLASVELREAVKNYFRLGGKPEDIKHFL